MRLVVMALLLVVGCTPASETSYRNGDIIFHESRSSQSEALRLAMNSRYTHMGVIYINDGKPFVYEAVGPVKVTP
ncbi:MAG: hypothetical protein OES25_16925, partial [Acidobacteriota bacterium]|nr:hypothetical protein [Acidobacteriota bacterium]